MKTLKEVSKLTSIKVGTLRQRINRGTLKATKRGRDWFIKDSDIKKLMVNKKPPV